MRNVVPRQGTEILTCLVSVVNTILRNVVPRQGTEIITIEIIGCWIWVIEKCSSPTGDGNHVNRLKKLELSIMIKVFPRQGTEIGKHFAFKIVLVY